MNNLLTYSNGYGHLIMSIFMTLVGLALILVPGVNTGAQGVGIGIILAVQAAWFVPGAAKQVAPEVVKQMNAPTPSITIPVQTPTLRVVPAPTDGGTPA